MQITNFRLNKNKYEKWAWREKKVCLMWVHTPENQLPLKMIYIRYFLSLWRRAAFYNMRTNERKKDWACHDRWLNLLVCTARSTRFNRALRAYAEKRRSSNRFVSWKRRKKTRKKYHAPIAHWHFAERVCEMSSSGIFRLYFSKFVTFYRCRCD